MTGEWRTVAANEFCASVRDGTHDSPKSSHEGKRLVTSRHITNRRLDLKSAYLISHEDFDEINRRSKVDKWDVLISMIGTVGEPCLISEEPDFAIKNIGLFKSRGEPEGKYLYYFLQSPGAKQHIHEQSRGTTQAYIPLGALREFPIRVPSDKVRMQAIACILGALDDKIELNRRLNRTMEAMAAAIFKSWFVVFAPVHAKASGFQPLGLTPEIAALFPDAFVDSDLGEIPQGWMVRSLPDILTINPSRSLSKGSLAPYLDMAGMPTEGPSPEKWVMREMGSGMKFINGDTLVARITPCLENGKTAFVDFLADGQVGWGSTEYIVLRPKGAIPPVFAYQLARTMEFRNFAVQQMTGSSGRQRVPADSLSKFKIVTPDVNSDLFARFGNLVTPMFKRIERAMHQTRAIAALRDTLLPKLISGELRVPDAERIVGRVG